MVQSKDASFKFISQDNLRELLDIVKFDLGIEINPEEVEVLTSETVAIEPSLMRPDYIIKFGNIIIMIEFESSHVGTKKKKLFKLYIASYDYKKNEDNNQIIFLVISTKEKSKMAEYSINDWDSFKFPILSLQDLDKSEIINNIETKIKNNGTYTNRELLELAITPILEDDRQSIINQFRETKEIMARVDYPNEEIKTSAYGIILMLSSMYFDELDPIRKEIQGDMMGKVDCVMEACNESYDNGMNDKSIEIAINFLRNSNDSLEKISKITGLPLEKVMELKSNL